MSDSLVTEFNEAWSVGINVQGINHCIVLVQIRVCVFTQ